MLINKINNFQKPPLFDKIKNLLDLPKGIKLYFSYGSNMKELQIMERIKLKGGIVQGPLLGKLNNYRLEFSKTSKKPGIGFANIHKDKYHTTFGYVYALNDEGFAMLDIDEGCESIYSYNEDEEPNSNGHYYRMKCKVDVILMGKYSLSIPLKAIVYKAHKNMVKCGLKPSNEYVEKLLDGKRLLPPEYCSFIKKLSKRPSYSKEIY